MRHIPLLVAFALCAGLLNAQRTNKYLDIINGNDAWDGSSATHTPTTLIGPWQTLEHAIASVSSNSRVNIANGTYDTLSVISTYEPLVFDVANVHWVATNGFGYVRFRPRTSVQVAPTIGWTNFHGDVYQLSMTWAVNPAPQSSDQLYGRWIINGPDWALAPYSDTDLSGGAGTVTAATHLDSSNDNFVTTSEGYYCGPGCYAINSSGWKARCRMTRESQIEKWEAHTSQTAVPDEEYPANPDPDDYAWALFYEPIGVYVDADQNEFFEIIFEYAEKNVEIEPGADNTKFWVCLFDYGRYGVTTGFDNDDGVGNNGLQFNGCKFTAMMPPWFPRSDVKASFDDGGSPDENYAPLRNFQSAGVELGDDSSLYKVSNVIFDQCVFEYAFDGIDMQGDPDHVYIMGCTFDACRDDGIEIASGATDVQIGPTDDDFINEFLGCNSAISVNGSDDPSATTKWIFGNIMDTGVTRLNYARNDDGTSAADPAEFYNIGWLGPNGYGWGVNAPFETHDSGSTVDVWKIYHNTILWPRPNGDDSSSTEVGMRCNNKAGFGFIGTGSTSGGRQEVMNNIFYMQEDCHVHVGLIVKDGSTAADSPEYFNGNLYYYNTTQTNGHIYQTTKSTARADANYKTVSGTSPFQGSNHQNDTGAYSHHGGTPTHPKWESDAVQGNPVFTGYVPSTGGAANNAGVHMYNFGNTNWKGISVLYPSGSSNRYIGAKIPQ